jgi:hypothetical protein
MRTTALIVVLMLSAAATWAQYMRPDFEPMPTDLGQTWVEIGGEIYGARPADLGPVGGGEGYQRTVTEGDYTVKTIDELPGALAKAQPGEVVYLDPQGDYDCTSLVFAEGFIIEIPEGVTLAGNRGVDGSRGAVIYSDNFATRPLIRALGPNVRMTGIWLRGPDPKRRLEHHNRSFNAERGDREAQHVYYYKFPVCAGISTTFDGLEVDNCEISGWSHAGISLAEGRDHHIHHNYIHHNQMNGLGYGVSHGYGKEAVSLIEYNVFDANRHSIAGTGSPGNAYEACNNVELGVSLSHCFDMHGGADRRDDTVIAGDWLKIHHNTFRAPIRAIAIRGVPQQQADIHHNWFFQSEPGSLTIMPWPTGAETNVKMHENAYGARDPAVWDIAYNSYQEALAAGMTAYKARQTAQARARFTQALELAGSAAERANVQLHIGHCYLSDRAYHVARHHYEAVLNTPGADARDLQTAQSRLQQVNKATPKSTRQWDLAFSDDFERDQLGDDWKVLFGEWHIEAGKLVATGGHAEIAITKKFPGCQRIEFDAMTNAERPCDFSPSIQGAARGTVRDTGYLLQFGGAGNTLNRILRNDQQIEDRSVQRFIEAGKVHHLVAELDGNAIRLTVDGYIIMEAEDLQPLVGVEHEMVGLYLYSESVIDNVKVFTSAPR